MAMQPLVNASPGSARAGAELRLEGISKIYGDFAAVDNLDLTVAPGEFVTLLGSSGSGKTTTLMMLAGFTAPTCGRITLGGRDVTALEPGQRDLGVVFQNYSLFPHLTVAQNLAFPLQMRRMPKAQIASRVQAGLEMVQLGDKGGRFPRELSGGQQQRVALARALIFEPQALLMDEPLGALDKNLREHMQLEIKRLHASLGATIVFVTHDQEEALTMSDRIAVMQDGRISQIASPQAIYERPANRWVAEFIGQSNFLMASVLESLPDDGYRVRMAGGEVLEARGVPGLAIGSRVEAVLRPEKITLTTAPAAGHSLRGRVRDLLYLGHTVKLNVVLGDGSELLVQAPNRASEALPQPGAEVSLGWAPGSLWLIGAGE